MAGLIQEANLPNLFQEEGDEADEPQWRFQGNIAPQHQAVAQPVALPVPNRFENEEEEDIDMGNLFGDDDDY